MFCFCFRSIKIVTEPIVTAGGSNRSFSLIRTLQVLNPFKMSDNFIPINGDKNEKKRKHQDKSSSGHKSTSRDEKPKSVLKSESQCPKLKDRICKYLEANKYKVKAQ